MRHTYTCIFRDVLTSRVWSLTPSHRCVWLWLQLSADPEGFVCADVRGIAISAHVETEQAKEALELLADLDPYAHPDDPHQGRVVEKVPGGYRLLGFEEQRELARREAHNARQRRYQKRLTAAANDTTDANPGVTKPKPKPKPDPQEGISPLPPVETWAEPIGFEAPSYLVPPPVIHVIPADYQPSAELLDAARMAGVGKFDEHLARLRTGPIGGTRGIFADGIEDYLRSMFGKWRSWEETDRSKQGSRTHVVPEPLPKPPEVPGMPVWVHKDHQAFVKERGGNLKKLARQFWESHHIPPETMLPNDAAAAFSTYLLTKLGEAA